MELSEGSSFFVSGAFYLEHRLAAGVEVGDLLFAEIREESEYQEAMAKGLELLARRDHSCFELARKLVVRSFAGTVVDRVVDRLRQDGYLDDRRYAESWTRSRLRKHPEGYSRLAAGLAKRGINRHIIAAVLRQVFTDAVAESAIERAAEKIAGGRDIDDQALIKKLTARGFTFRQAQVFLQKLK